jgi:hypothetical protein
MEPGTRRISAKQAGMGIAGTVTIEENSAFREERDILGMS